MRRNIMIADAFTPCLVPLMLALLPPGEAKPAKAAPAKTAAAKSTPAEALAAKVQSFYDRSNDLSADFIQLYTRVALSKTSEQRGKVSLKKPGMMRWDYQKPAPKHFVADGKKLFVYEPEEEQVIEKDFKAGEVDSSIGFLWGRGHIAKSFEIKLADPAAHGVKGEDRGVLELTPRSDATYTKLVLIVDTKSGMMLESILFETSGNKNHFKFENVKTNTGLAADLFQFKPPPGVTVVPG